MSVQSSDPLNVVVTGIGGGGHGEQTLKALRMAKRPYRVIGCDMNPHSSGFAMVDVPYVVPPARDPAYIDTIIGLCKKHHAVAVFHGSELEMMALDAARDEFRAEGIYLPINPSRVLQICQDKVRTAEFLDANGFCVPAFREVSRPEDLERFNHLPVVVKPSVGGGGSRNAFIAQTEAELHDFSAYLLKIVPRFIVQEYVGTPDREYTVGVLFGRDGELINSIAVHRILETAMSVAIQVPNRTARRDLGDTLVISTGISQGRVGRHPAVTSPCEAIASALEPTAPINIQCRLVGDKVYVFEINARFSGTTSLRAMAGYNEPDTLIRRDVLGEEIELHFEYEECLILRGLAETKLTPQSVLQARECL